MKIHPLIPLLAAFIATAVFSADVPKNKWETMDYGPFLSMTLNLGKANNGSDNPVLKATVVKLGDKTNPVCVAYDTETMRVAAVWEGGFIDWKGVIFNGDHHAQPRPKGTVLYSEGETPFWSPKKPFVDPRPDHRGPLPNDMFHFNGIYHYGDQVFFSYRAQGVEVYEQPAVEKGEDGQPIFVRYISAWNPPPASDEKPNRKRGPNPRRHAIRISLAENADRTPTEGLDERNIDLRTQFRGGPPLWPESVTTSGTLGKEDSPYVVDTLTLPEKNPWNSWMRLGGFDFFADGKRAAICTWNGDVWVVTGIDDSLAKLSWKRYAAGLYQPLGLKIVDEKILVTCRDRIVRLHDLNADGEADFYENFNGDFILSYHFHEFMMDLQTDAEGNFYFAKGGTPGVGGPNFDIVTPHNGAFFKLSKDGSKLDIVARGLRAPNGIGVGPNGELTSGDNEGSWVPICPINEIKPGGFVGVVPESWPNQPPPDHRDPPILWMPFHVDNSAGAQVWVTSKKWGPFENEMLHLSYGKATLFHVMTEHIDGQIQGAAAKFPLQFGSGIMRARFNALDGQLYVCGLKGWQTTAARDGIFQRVRYTGRDVTLPAQFHVIKDGVSIAFTNPVDKKSAEDTANYAAWWFNVKWAKTYGSDRWSPTDPAIKWPKNAVNPPGEALAIKSAKLSPDGKSLVLEIPGLKPVTNMILNMKIQAADGTRLYQEICNTIHNVPK